MPTFVPQPSFTDRGYVAPLESAILTGTQSDINAAFGGNLNPALNTPQGQIATSEAAIIADKDSQFLALANGVDPAYASGRMQDAIGRIYYITRIPAASTVVTVRCIGGVGVVIPLNAQVADQAGNVYLCTQSGTIPVGGYIDLSFACVTMGPIACPIGFINTIYQAIPGWDSVTNLAAGVIGRDVENRADFEFKRSNSVAKNAQGSLNSIVGEVFNLPGVLDVYGLENDTSETSGAVINGTISGTTLTVNSLTSGTVAIGQTVIGSGIAQGTYITGGTGPYAVNISQSVGPEAMTCAFGGVPLVKNSIYISVYGGVAQDIGQAIATKKSPGCNYNGNTTITVMDTQNGLYTPPYPSYPITFEVPTPTAIKFAVSMANNTNVPSNAILLIQNAIIASFNGQDGGQRARIGSNIFHSRYYANIFALGSWVQVYEIKVGVGTANMDSVLMQVNQVPTLSASDISVVFS
jgi:hypothetical protein